MNTIRQMILPMIGMFLIGFGLYVNYSAEQKMSTIRFYEAGQYEPEYMSYDHEQMIDVCEKHGLFYYAELGECTLSVIVD